MDLRLTIAALLWVALFGTALYPALRKGECASKHWWKVFATFLALLAVALPVWRCRSLLYPGEINVDESQVLAQVLRYRMDPVPWRSVDGGSGGPLYTWAVMWAPLLGLKADYFAARATSLVCFFGLLSGLVMCLKELTSTRLSLLFAMPAVTLVLVSLNLDYVFYSSEQLPSAIMAWVVYLILRQSESPTVLKAGLMGALTGSLPFCKIQVGPAGVYLFFVALAVCWFPLRTWRGLRPYALSLAVGGLLVPLFIMVPVAVGGAFGDFWNFYIKTSIGYKSTALGSASLGVKLSAFSTLFTQIWEFRAFLLSCLCLTTIALFDRRGRLLSAPANVKLAVGAFLAFALILSYSIYRTGYLFPHYTLFLVLPYALLPGAIMLFKSPSISGEPSEGTSATNSATEWLVLAAFLPAAIQGFSTVSAYSNPSNRPFLGDWGPGVPPLGEYLRKLVPQGETMLVWGYAPKFHVFSQVPSSVRTTSPINLFMGDSLNDKDFHHFEEAFFQDLKQYAPAIIIDAPDEFVPLDPNYPRGVLARHSLHRSMADFVKNDYELVQQIPTMPGKVPMLVYKKRQPTAQSPEMP